MKISRKTLKLALGFMFLPVAINAQVTISGEVRPRTEYRHGFKTLYNENGDPAFFTEQRTRLMADYKSDKFFAVLSLQDVRVWGAVSQIYKSDPSLSAIHMGYAGYNFSKKLVFTAGRMELDYDNARILGNLSWAQQSRSHDLMKLTYTDSLWAIHGGVAFNQDAATPEPGKLQSTFYSGVTNYKTMQYLWFNKMADMYTVSLLFMNQGFQVGVVDSSDIEYNQTFGTYIKLGKKIKGTIEGYLQTGMDGKGKDLSAYMLAGSVTVPVTSKLPITLGFDYLSGTKAGETKNKSFNPFYGTNHKFYGSMDYFYVGNPHKNIGLTDIYISSTLGLGKTSTLTATAHQFLSPVEVVDANQVSLSSNLGTEIDLLYNLNLTKGVTLTVGYSQMFATTTMETVKPGGSKEATSNWAFLMFTFKPVFFTSK